MVSSFVQGNFSDTAEVAFLFAPRLTHDRVERLTPTQQAEALHEFVEYRDAVKRHVFNPGKNPHTRVLALATLIDQAEKTCAKHKAISEPQPFWIGKPDMEGSFAARTGLGQNFISSELQRYEKAGLVNRPHRRSDNGNDHLDLAVLPALLTDVEQLPAKGERPRKPPVLCKSCGSEVLVKEVRTQIICACCGTIHSEHKSQTMVNEPEEEAPIITREVTIEETDIITSQVTIQTDTIITREVTIGDEDEEADSPPTTLSPSQLLAHAAAYLVKVAGDEPLHAEMNAQDKDGNPLKYGPVRSQFGLQDARDHLIGKKTKAARILRADGNTYALVFDADTDEDTEKMRLGAHLLTSAGYKVLLDEADSARGPHMWVLYNDLVDARSARRHVCEIAPMLQDIKEYWPHYKQNVRLLGGKYVTPTVSEQCKLYDGYGALVASTGRETAAALLAYQNAANIVPDYPPDPEPEKTRKPQSVEKAHAPVGAQGDGPTVRDLVAFFNETHQLENIHSLETKDHARAIWRAEKGRPSVSYLSDNRWYDHGHADQKTGDAFDLACLVWDTSKSQMLSETRKEWLAVYGGRGLDDQAQPLTVKTEQTVEDRETLQGGLSAQKTVDFSHLPEEIQTLCREHNLTPSDPCSACGCPLHNRLDECARCYPVKSKPSNLPYAEYGSEIIDRVYPRPRPVQTVQFGGKSHAA